MNVLWDFRLLSLGYRDRGVGRLAISMAQSIIDMNPQLRIFVWGDPDRAVDSMKVWPVTWIPYRPGNWKLDIVRLPRILRRNRIDVLHHWVTLGPLRNVSMGVVKRCATVGLVADLGVELWDGIPFLKSTRHSMYWRLQRILAHGLDRVVCPLDSTSTQVTNRLQFLCNRSSTIRMPVGMPVIADCSKRLPCIVTLGGSPHKNVVAVVKAFELARSKLAAYRLVILGEFDEHEEHVGSLPEGAVREGMDRYDFYLSNAQLLAVCSFYEGLGIPVLDAMQRGCPLLMSDIPQLRETAGKAGAFARPDDIPGIASCMEDLVKRNAYWSAQSYEGGRSYYEQSRDCGRQWLDLYTGLAARAGV